MNPSRHLSYANVASTLAVVLALGGGGAAVAAGVAKNSVGSKQIKAGAVKTADLGADAVDSTKVKDGSLTSGDLQDGTVTGADVLDGSITGADILESSLDLPEASLTVGPGLKYLEGVKTLVSGFNQVGTVQFTAPAAGKVLVSWSGSFDAGETGTYIEAVVKADGVAVGGAWLDPGDVDNFFDQAQTVSTVAAVAKGAHTYTVEIEESSVSADYSSLTGGDVTVLFVPAG